jgi:hypothetical protein
MESGGIMPPPAPVRMRKRISEDQSQAKALPRVPRLKVPRQIRYRVRGPTRPLNQPRVGMVTVRAIPKAVMTQ